MPVKPYPSNTVILYVDDRVLDRDMKLALRRSWTYVADAVVRANHVADEQGEEAGGAPGAAEEAAQPTQAAAAEGEVQPATAQASEGETAEGEADEEEAAPEYSPALQSYVQIRVKFGTRSYLYSASDEEADANWNERVAKHIETTLFKVANNNKIFNRYQRNNGAPELAFDYIEFVLENGALTLEYRLDSNSDVPREYASAASQIRELLNAGALGEGVTRVRMPATASYQQQAAYYEEHRAEIEAARAAEEEAARLAAEEQAEQEEQAAEESFQESPEQAKELEEEEKIDVYKQTYEPEPMTAEERKARYEFPDADFAIDYRLWDIVYEDGSSRAYDSEGAAFVAAGGQGEA